MNIREAKEQILNTVTAYLAKDEYGAWEIPPEQQRPVFMVGAPGIGKTAIMRQVAEALKVNLVSYSMTHHTRQSALGLPHIVEKPWGTVTEYTMSEIIAACYEAMDLTGIQEGILFLDEVNCVSETLSPSMLQFLQFKTFGQHRVPEGWVIVTAGNPPEYNRSVREFDVVMLDRLKVIPIEPDYPAWKAYAALRRVHPAITGFLETHRDAFYRVETTAGGRQYVTARGWEDLSVVLRLYEKRDMAVNEALIGQYLCIPRICTEFTAYYELFLKYRERFDVAAILRGEAEDGLIQQAMGARFDERYAIVGLLIDGLSARLGRTLTDRAACSEVIERLKVIKARVGAGATLEAALSEQVDGLKAEMDRGRQDHLMPEDRLRALQRARELLQSMGGEAAAFDELKAALARRLSAHEQCVAEDRGALDHAFDFCEQAFSEGQEMLILVTEMTVVPPIAHFIAQFGCERYFAHSRDLVFYERNKEIGERLKALELGNL